MADTDLKREQTFMADIVNQYLEIEKKAGKLMDKKQEALEWLDNRYVYLIIVLSALIGAAKDKLDSFYDDFQENLIDLHHNQRTKCMERRKNIEEIHKSAVKKRHAIQTLLKSTSPKKIRKVSDKMKVKVQETDETLSKFENEEFIDYQFDTKEALRKVCLAMVTSTDVQLVSVPLKCSGTESNSDNIKVPSAQSTIDKRISDAFEKGLKNTVLPVKEMRFHYKGATFEGSSDDSVEVNDSEEEIDGDVEECKHIAVSDVAHRIEGDEVTRVNAVESEITPVEPIEELPITIDKPNHVTCKEIVRERSDIVSSEIVVSDEPPKYKECICGKAKPYIDHPPNGYGRSTKYVFQNNSKALPLVVSEHNPQKDCPHVRRVHFSPVSELSTSDLRTSPKINKFADKNQNFTKYDFNRHVGVTMPVQTESPQSQNSVRSKSSQNKDSTTYVVECCIERNCDAERHNAPVGIERVSKKSNNSEDDLLINGVLDSIDSTDDRSPHKPDVKSHKPNGEIKSSKSESSLQNDVGLPGNLHGMTLQEAVRYHKEKQKLPEKEHKMTLQEAVRLHRDNDKFYERVQELSSAGAEDLAPIKISEVRLQGSRCHTGVFIDDQRILFPDYVFEKLKIFDLHGNEINRFTLFRKPWDVACNTKGEIVVSFPNSMCIKTYKLVQNSLIEMSSVDTFAYGVDGFDDVLGNNFLFVNEKHVSVLEADGKLFRTIPTSCIDSKVIGSKKELKFYYTNGNDIICETKWGKKICTYSYPINETPIALSLDLEGNLFVCCFNAGQISIYKVSINGKHFLVAKLPWLEPDLPRKIVFDSKGEHFFVVSHLETPPNLNHVERSRELLLIQTQILEAGLAVIYKLSNRKVETAF